MQKLLALAGLETPFDKQEAPLEQATDLVLNGFAFTSQAAGYFIFGRRSTALQLGVIAPFPRYEVLKSPFPEFAFSPGKHLVFAKQWVVKIPVCGRLS